MDLQQRLVAHAHVTVCPTHENPSCCAWSALGRRASARSGSSISAGVEST